MSSGDYLKALSSWQVIFACLFLMILMPLTVMIASRKAPRRPIVLSKLKKLKSKKPEKAKPAPNPSLDDEEEERPEEE